MTPSWSRISGGEDTQRRAAVSAFGRLYWRTVEVCEEFDGDEKTGRVRVTVVLEPMGDRVKTLVPDPDPLRDPPGTR